MVYGPWSMVNTQMKTCESYVDELKAYVDGELPMARKLSVRSHVAKCPACREEVTAMEQMGNELRMGDAGGLDTALKAKIMDGIPEAEANTAPRRWRPKPLEI